MKAVVTRVKSASVTIEGRINGAIEQGFLVLLGVGPEDCADTARKLAEKIYHVRVFADEAGKMNRSLEQVGGSMLVVSQFTLYADLKKRRPGFSHAAPPDKANALYEAFMQDLRDLGVQVEHGEFGADMQVESVNDGPVTLCFDTEDF
ncbi:MAG: D-tyrosyl-tRNA(Tyr) deacylase [Selenomonas sp.]|uniref:D-aminoacyl-tRNA deacylase n=1 Tax=Selenomonas sp. TaxID=2053611 RepID=UPI0025FEA8AA|nr:D-aminoacyl-tRNA deacylase [Selenomonas sp.]MCR5758035.1 D-tyrosyl-tRNA(Tyr) deacylase [Selenomonas sp.]